MNITIAVPTQELLNLAIEKAKGLKNNQMIWLTGGHTHTYVVMRIEGKAFIGRDLDSPCKPFFKNAEVITMPMDGGRYTYLIQKMYKDKK